MIFINVTLSGTSCVASAGRYMMFGWHKVFRRILWPLVPDRPHQTTHIVRAGQLSRSPGRIYREVCELNFAVIRCNCYQRREAFDSTISDDPHNAQLERDWPRFAETRRLEQDETAYDPSAPKMLR